MTRKRPGVFAATALTAALVATASPAPPLGAFQSGRESLKIHGRWTIVVRNPDRSIASRHEFDNALVNPSWLVRLMAGAGPYNNGFEILIGPYDRPSIEADQRQRFCVSPDRPDVHCRIVLAGHSNVRYVNEVLPQDRMLAVENLLVEPIGNTTLQLTGFFKAARDGEIQDVALLVEDGTANQTVPLTHRNLTRPDTPGAPVLPPIPVKGDQVVDIVVVLTFG